MTEEEKKVVDEFQGEAEYNKNTIRFFAIRTIIYPM
jgi:hypothetical protein